MSCAVELHNFMRLMPFDLGDGSDPGDGVVRPVDWHNAHLVEDVAAGIRLASHSITCVGVSGRSALRGSAGARRSRGPQRVGDLGLRAEVEGTEADLRNYDTRGGGLRNGTFFDSSFRKIACDLRAVWSAT